eukprot:14251910-Alexandrium_andersonii.AAC.1
MPCAGQVGLVTFIVGVAPNARNHEELASPRALLQRAMNATAPRLASWQLGRPLAPRFKTR